MFRREIPALQGDEEVTPEVQNLYAQAKEARQRGDDATAIEKYKAIIKLAPHLAAAYNNLGMLYFNGQDYTRAAEVLQRGLQLNSQHAGRRRNAGHELFSAGKPDKAEPLLEKALRANPKDDQVEMVLVHILINMQKLPEAAYASQRLPGAESEEPGCMVPAGEDLSADVGGCAEEDQRDRSGFSGRA